MSLAADIELWLLTRGDWVSAEEICQRFSIRPRMLRADGDRAGLLDQFAVSSTKEGGYKHIALISGDEFRRLDHRLRRHAIAELRRSKLWRRARRNCLTGRAPTVERHTGQGLLFS